MKRHLSFGLPAVVLTLTFLAACNPEKRDFNRTAAANTVPAYEAFLQKYPAGPHAARAHEALVYLLLAEAKATNKISALVAFLEKHEDSVWSEKAVSEIEGSQPFPANLIPADKTTAAKYERARSLYQKNTVSGLIAMVDLVEDGSKNIEEQHLKTLHAEIDDASSYVRWLLNRDLRLAKTDGDVRGMFIAESAITSLTGGPPPNASDQAASPRLGDWLEALFTSENQEGKNVWNLTHVKATRLSSKYREQVLTGNLTIQASPGAEMLRVEASAKATFTTGDPPYVVAALSRRQRSTLALDERFSENRNPKSGPTRLAGESFLFLIVEDASAPRQKSVLPCTYVASSAMKFRGSFASSVLGFALEAETYNNRKQGSASASIDVSPGSFLSPGEDVDIDVLFAVPKRLIANIMHLAFIGAPPIKLDVRPEIK